MRHDDLHDKRVCYILLIYFIYRISYLANFPVQFESKFNYGNNGRNYKTATREHVAKHLFEVRTYQTNLNLVNK